MLAQLSFFGLLGHINGQAQEEAVIVSAEFLQACTEGKVETVEALLKDHPEWKDGRSEQGETCLHVRILFYDVCCE